MPSSPPRPSLPSGSATSHVSPWWGLPSLVIPLVTALFLSWHSMGDLDIWFHLRAGRDLLDGQGISQVNKYSFTEPDHPWVNHEWMFQVLTAWTGPESPLGPASPPAPDVRGWNGMRTALVLLIVLAVLAGDGLGDRLRGRQGTLAAAWAGLPLVAGLVLMWPRLTLRPELFSYLFFVAALRDAERVFHSAGDGRGSWRDLVDPRLPSGRLVLLSALWAQFHGFAILAPGLVLLAVILAPRQRGTAGPTSRNPFSLWQSIGLVGLVLAALAVTPNGPAGLLMPIRALGQFQHSDVNLQTTVSELVPLQQTPNALGLTIGLYRASLLFGAAWIVATWGRIGLLRLLVFGLAAVGAWMTQRTIGFYGLTFILLLTGTGPGRWIFGLERYGRRLPVRLAAGVGLIISAVFAGLLWPGLISDDFYLHEGVGRRFGAGVNPARFPGAVAAGLREAGPVPYFANLDAAAYLLANSPGPIFIDGRTEAYSSDLWAQYNRIKKGNAEGLAILDTWNTEAVALSLGSGAFTPLAQSLLAADSWQLSCADPAGLLFLADDPSHPSGDILEAAALKALERGAEESSTRRADWCLAAGELYRLAGNGNRTEEAFRRGLASRPDHPTLNHNLGNILLGRQDYPEALRRFEMALKTNPRLGGSALNAGVCQMRLGLPDKAARLFRQAARIDPGSFEAWVNLAAARMALKDRPGAVQALEKAVQLRPDDPRLVQRLREWKRGVGN